MRAFLSRNATVLFCLLAAVVTAYTYSGIANGYLYNDDFRWMSQARYKMTPGNVLTFQVFGFFRPLMNVIYYVTERLMPGNLPAYYATNLALHLLCGMLVYYLLLKLVGNRVVAAATSLLFLITSTHYAAVGWISARTTLVSTVLFLGSLVVLVGQPKVRWRRLCAVALYALALAAKEDVVAGVLLLGLIYLYRKRSEETLPDRRMLADFAVTSLAYMIVRTAFIGHVTQDNWGPGLHAVRNLAGGLLYQFYPWSLVTLAGAGRNIPAPTNPLWPEILIIPVLSLLFVVASLLKRSRDIRFGVAWTLIALLPVSMFKLRFFTTEWLTHDRYYYLPSIGGCLCVVSVLAGMWGIARWRYAFRTVVVFAVLVIALGEPVAVRDREARLHKMMSNYRQLVSLVGHRLDAEHEYNTCALDNWLMQPAFVRDVFALERPMWRIVPIHSASEATLYKPCLYVKLMVDGSRVTTVAAAIE